jgi:hypothetical protein
MEIRANQPRWCHSEESSYKVSGGLFACDSFGVTSECHFGL